MRHSHFIYILTNQRNGTLYTGMTNDLVKRCAQHRSGKGSAFTEKHHIKYLVWYEGHAGAASAIAREKSVKRWERTWKLEAIEKVNPDWHDLSFSLGGAAIEACPMIPDPYGSADRFPPRSNAGIER
ncbi:GIY-YIG nuclease family protein [Minwuia sp.]|uniref:GIY-YIG nuclease family protein n=1 Tax=Minwuia sp. TaxID=2493630 RepID=UPI003A930BBE